MGSTDATDPTALNENEVVFDYIKSNDFRVIWADGIVGNVTPHGLVHFAIFSERQAFPRRQVYAIDTDNDGNSRLGSEKVEKQITRGSLVREMACDVFTSPDTAESLAHWLLKQVEEARKMQETKE